MARSGCLDGRHGCIEDTSGPLHNLTPRPDCQTVNLVPEISAGRPRLNTADARLVARGFAGITSPVAVFWMSPEEMAILHPERARMSPSDVDSWCPPRGITRPLEVTPSCVPEPRTAIGAVRPLVRPTAKPYDWAAVPVDPYLT